MTRAACKAVPEGFGLAEVLVAVALIGICLAPFLLYLGRVSRLQRDLGMKARSEAWQSFQEHALSAGLDPGTADAFSRQLNSSVPGFPALRTERIALPVEPGKVALRILRQADAAETGRAYSSGWELAQGSELPAALPPPLMLPPIILAPPVVAPNGSTGVPISTLQSDPENISSLLVRASSSEGAWVCLSTGTTLASGAGEATTQIPVAALAAGVEIRAWCEYPGNAGDGDVMEILNDGRRRWTVSATSGAQRHDPSEMLRVSYCLDLGAPVLRYAGVEYENSRSLELTRQDLANVAAGTCELRVTWPAATLGKLGTTAAILLQGFDLSFLGQPGVADGSLTAFCTTEQLTAWGDANELRVTPLLAQGCVGASASWSILRRCEQLGEPELLGSSVEDVFSTDPLVFVPPAQADGCRRGRLSARDGSLVSSGDSLSLSLVP